MNRLLSEQEICKGCLSLGGENCEDCEYRIGAQDGATAQLSQADKEWVEWIGESLIEVVLNFNMTVGNRNSLLKLWQERKKEIGYEL